MTTSSPRSIRAWSGAWLVKCQISSARGDDVAALAAAEAALAQAPSSPEAHYWRGALLGDLGHVRAGLAAIERAFALAGDRDAWLLEDLYFEKATMLDALVLRALAQVGNIVDVDALGRGAVVARLAPVRLAAQVEGALATVAADVAARALIIERAIDDDLIAEVDPRLVGRVLGCLLDYLLYVCVADGERARRGRGLGLHFCRLVAEAHGGSITAGSQPTLPVEFVLRLPR